MILSQTMNFKFYKPQYHAMLKDVGVYGMGKDNNRNSG